MKQRIIAQNNRSDFTVFIQDEESDWMSQQSIKLAHGSCRKRAYRAAARRLRTLANECERRSK